MKKLFPWKIKIPFITVVYFLIMVFCGMFKNCIFLFMMISFHELSHCLSAALLKMKVDKITVYPFGMQASISNLGFYSSYKELLVLLAGPATHLINPFIFTLLVKMNLISLVMEEWLLNMNRGMLIMNLLPIYPLDGGRILNEIIHFFFPYGISEKITYVLSFINLLLLFLSRTMNNAAGIVIQLFIFLNLARSVKDFPIVKKQFYRFRILNPASGKMHVHSYFDLYKNCRNRLRIQSKVMDEREWLLEQFHENSQQRLQKNLNGVL